MSSLTTPTGLTVAPLDGINPAGSAVREYSLDEFTAMDNRGLELVDGRLVEKGLGRLSSRIGTQIAAALSLHVTSNNLGEVHGSEGGYRLFPHRPRHVRTPDVSFIAAARLNSISQDGWMELVPDLAVEVVSTQDKAEALEEKLDEYRAAAIPMIWIVWPNARKVEVIRHGHAAVTFRGLDDTLDGGDVIPGFTLRLAEIFVE